MPELDAGITTLACARLFKVFADALEPIVIVDFQGRIVDLNDEVVRNYGWTRDDLPRWPRAETVAGGATGAMPQG